MRKVLLTLGLIFSFSVGVMAAPHAFPVPWVADQHTTINFNELPGSGTIQVFTITGEEVVQLNIPPGAGLVSWNVKNASGSNLATGVYLYLIKSGDQKTTGKLVVIR